MADNAPLPPVDANVLAQMLGVTPKEAYDLTKVGSSTAALGGSTQLRTACGGLRVVEAEGDARQLRSAIGTKRTCASAMKTPLPMFSQPRAAI